MKETITKNNMVFQLPPPHDHHRNLAKKAIQTFKDHFVAILCGADKLFPLHLWDRLLWQAEHTLNMLRPSRITLTMSVYAYLWKQHDYNANPFAPLGCKVEAHIVQQFVNHGHRTPPVDSMSTTHGIIIGATRFISPKQNTQEYAIRYSSNTST
jgi:hypothetical protein